MKMQVAKFIIVGALILPSAQLSAQKENIKTNPIPTVQPGATWHWLERWMDTPDGYRLDSVKITHMDSFQDSLVLDNKTYYLVYKDIPTVLFREDLQEGKIYIRYNNRKSVGNTILTTEDLVLFDYNKQVGDKVTLFDFLGSNWRELQEGHHRGGVTPSITQITTQNIGGKERRVYTFNRDVGRMNQNPLQWIEGIGYNLGFILDIPAAILGKMRWSIEALCHTSPEGEIVHLHPSGLCKIGIYDGIDASSIKEKLQITGEGEYRLIALPDGKEHTLSIFQMDGTPIVQEITFDHSCPIPANLLPFGTTVLIVIDGVGIPYLL